MFDFARKHIESGIKPKKIYVSTVKGKKRASVLMKRKCKACSAEFETYISKPRVYCSGECFKAHKKL